MARADMLVAPEFKKWPLRGLRSRRVRLKNSVKGKAE
jgi:hypothetical protein